MPFDTEPERDDYDPCRREEGSEIGFAAAETYIRAAGCCVTCSLNTMSVLTLISHCVHKFDSVEEAAAWIRGEYADTVIDAIRVAFEEIDT